MHSFSAPALSSLGSRGSRGAFPSYLRGEGGVNPTQVASSYRDKQSHCAFFFSLPKNTSVVFAQYSKIITTTAEYCALIRFFQHSKNRNIDFNSIYLVNGFHKIVLCWPKANIFRSSNLLNSYYINTMLINITR